MSQHQYCTEQHGGGVGHVLEGLVEAYVPRSLLKHHVLPAYVLPRTNPRTAHQARTDIAYYVTIEVRHHHYIKLVWVGNQLESVCVCVCVMEESRNHVHSMCS